MVSTSIKLVGSFRLYLFILSIVPFILLNIISINYADLLDNVYTINLSSYYVFLSAKSSLPVIVNKLGVIYILSLYVIFTIWYILFVMYTYNILSNQNNSWFSLLLESALLSFIYFKMLSASGWLYYLIGVLGSLLLFGLILVYWLYDLKDKNQ